MSTRRATDGVVHGYTGPPALFGISFYLGSVRYVVTPRPASEQRLRGISCTHVESVLFSTMRRATCVSIQPLLAAARALLLYESRHPSLPSPLHYRAPRKILSPNRCESDSLTAP